MSSRPRTAQYKLTSGALPSLTPAQHAAPPHPTPSHRSCAWQVTISAPSNSSAAEADGQIIARILQILSRILHILARISHISARIWWCLARIFA